MEKLLIKSAIYGDLDGIKMALDQGVDPNYHDVTGDTALILATVDGNLEIVKELLNRGADPNIAGTGKWTALHTAAREKHLEILKELLEHGADPNLRNEYDQTALMLAARRGQTEMVKELLDHGADPNHVGNYDKFTALLYASDAGYLEPIRILLDRGADPNLRDIYGKRAIDIARRLGYKEIVDLLLAFNLSPTITDPNTGISNLAITAANGPLAQLEVMVDDNPDLNLNQQDLDGNTALIYAIINRQKEHVGLLLDRGADPNLSNNAGGTPLAYAIALNDPKLERMLIDVGAQ